MSESTALHDEIKSILIDDLMMEIEADEIGADTPLMGPDSLGLDSVDALQLVVAIEKRFGFKIGDPESAKQILRSVDSIAAAITAHRGA